MNQGIDGFDHYAGGTVPNADILQRTGSMVWTVPNGSGGTFTPSTNVRGTPGYGRSMQIGPTAGGQILNQSINAYMTSVYVGMAFEIQSAGVLQVKVTIHDTTTNCDQCYFVVDAASGIIFYYRAGNTSGPDTLLYTTLPNQINVLQWNYFEVGVQLSASYGSMEARVNGSTCGSVTNVNTIGSGASSHANLISWFWPGTYQYIDDAYCNDQQVAPGAYPCDGFMGDCRVATLFPTSNNGTPQWTPSPNTNANWQNVSEVAFDYNTTYNYTATAGNQDKFNCGSLVGTVDAVITVWVTGAYYKTDASSRTFEQLIVSTGGTEETSSAHTMSTSYQFFSDQFALDPATLAPWTATAVNSLVVGYDLVS